MERIPLHSWEMEFSIQYHVTINSQLNDQNSIRYYIKNNIVRNKVLITLFTLQVSKTQYSGQNAIQNNENMTYRKK
jgi:hypothetical protein